MRQKNKIRKMTGVSIRSVSNCCLKNGQGALWKLTPSDTKNSQQLSEAKET